MGFRLGPPVGLLLGPAMVTLSICTAHGKGSDRLLQCLKRPVAADHPPWKKMGEAVPAPGLRAPGGRRCSVVLCVPEQLSPRPQL